MANANIYDTGQLVRIKVVFTSVDTGLAVDPATITLKVLHPDGTIDSHTFGVDVVKDAAGTYHYDFTPSIAGDYWYKWLGTSPGQGVDEFYFKVSVPRIP